MLNLTYPLKPGSYHRVRNYQDHVNAGAGPWYGIDDGCVVGTEVLACDDGTISNTEKRTDGGGWNFRLNLTKYPGYFIWYAHCSQLPTNGQVLPRGQVIAHSGATGDVTGPHLHWSLLKGSTVLDPETNATFDQTGGVTNDMIDWQDLPDGSVFKHDDDATVYWAVPNQAAYAKYIGSADRLKTIPDPKTDLQNQINALNSQLQGANDQIASLDTQLKSADETLGQQAKQIADLQKQLGSQTTTTPPSTIPVGNVLDQIVQWFKDHFHG